MGRCTARRAWAITLNTEDVDVESTNNEARKFSFNNYTWEYFVGFPEGDEDTQSHRHCGIRCMDRPVSKTAARNAFAAAIGTNPDKMADNYFKEVETSWMKYMAYAFKGKHTQVDAAIKMAIQNIISKGLAPNKRTLTNALVEEHGPNNFLKNYKSVVDVYLHTDGLIDKRGQMVDELDFEENKANFLRSFSLFRENLSRALAENGFDTTWQGAENMTTAEVLVLCEILALLPICSKRSFTKADLLPCLYLWGKARSGKSAFFENFYLKKFPLDAEGVSRFKLTNLQSGLLFDDIGKDFWEKSSVTSTIRQMATGHNATIKTFGDTETVCGFLVVTSNWTPYFLTGDKPADMTDKDWDTNVSAMRRRFITIQFSEEVDLDPAGVVWSDLNLRETAAILAYKAILHLEKTQPDVVGKFLHRFKERLFYDYDLSVKASSVQYEPQVPPKKMLKRLGGVDFQKPPKKRVPVPKCACGNYADTCPDQTCRDMWEAIKFTCE